MVPGAIYLDPCGLFGTATTPSRYPPTTASPPATGHCLTSTPRCSKRLLISNPCHEGTSGHPHEPWRPRQFGDYSRRLRCDFMGWPLDTVRDIIPPFFHRLLGGANYLGTAATHLDSARDTISTLILPPSRRRRPFLNCNRFEYFVSRLSTSPLDTTALPTTT